uniref:CBM1 domain-containing protein n=1 Tax=Bionectria ochroleuca TaxID=29856 RepID=A0A0B7K7E1_BIOOC
MHQPRADHIKMRPTAAIVTLAIAAAPAFAQSSGNGTCALNPYKPEDTSLKCIWGQLANIQECAGGTSCSEKGNPCWYTQSCEGCAWWVKCT